MRNLRDRLFDILRFGRRAAAVWVFVGAGLTVAVPASADSSCREWRVEHRQWKSEAVRRYLDGSPGKALDTAIFELLQREAYLTSCDTSLARARGSFVGWRLVGHTPDEYAAEVVDTLLLRAGFPVRLRDLFGAGVDSAALVVQPQRHAGGLAPHE